jgi:hypothetical protein
MFLMSSFVVREIIKRDDTSQECDFFTSEDCSSATRCALSSDNVCVGIIYIIGLLFISLLL